MPGTVSKLAKNVQSTASVVGKAGSGFLTVFTNPYVWIVIGILFFPMNIFNYFILYVGNFFILVGNIFLFGFHLLLYGLLNFIGEGINSFIIEPFNNFSITIPIPGLPDPTVNFPDLPLIPTISFPSFGHINYYDISKASFFPSKLLLFWIFDLIGISLPL